jgi:phosphatidylglycerophosphate synthase
VSSGEAARPTDRDGYLDRWAGLHGGYDPRSSALVRWWLTITYAVARPVAQARVPPDLVTLTGLGASAAAVAVAAVGGRWLWCAAALVVLSGLLDGVDGAVAVLRDRVTRWGHVLDSVTDRVGDLMFLLALGVAGGPWQPCVIAGALMFLQEYARARAAVAGMSEVAVVTVGERPTRVIVTAAFLSAHAVLGQPWSTLGAWAWCGIGTVALVQLAVVVRRRLA